VGCCCGERRGNGRRETGVSFSMRTGRNASAIPLGIET
jgi:hypothetical protein